MQRKIFLDVGLCILMDMMVTVFTYQWVYHKTKNCYPQLLCLAFSIERKYGRPNRQVMLAVVDSKVTLLSPG